jgi:polysaccharide chain length determinant protein (PEP-CTERM system associated)
MGNLDLKFYWAVFLRRLPYFLVVAALLIAVAVTIAFVLPTKYRSSASMLVEPQQIPGELAESMVPINAYEQIQIIEQRLMTRANLLEMAQKIGLDANQPDLTASEIVRDVRQGIEFIGFEPDVTKMRGVPGATVIGVTFEAPTPQLAYRGVSELVNLILAENVKLRTGRAGDTLEFFQGEVEQLETSLAGKSKELAEFKTQNVKALPDSMVMVRTQQERAQAQLIDLEREEASLRNQRATVVWVFERTGRSAATATLSPEEEQLQMLQSQLVQARAIYNASSPQVRLLQTQLTALQQLVDQQQAARAVPDAAGNPAKPLTELDAELAPIDDRLKYIAEEKATLDQTLADLEKSIEAMPKNEMVISNMERDLASLQAQYDAALKNRGQAELGERMEVMSKGERFSLIEQPSLPSAPSAPKRMLIAAAGLVGGIAGGIGLVLLLEMLNRSIRRPLDIANGLGIQPLATIPYIRTGSETRWKRSAIIAALVMALGVIPLALLMVHIYYMPLDLLFASWGEALGFGGPTPPAPAS